MTIEKAAVIGAGVMGSAIAAHIANTGIPVYLFDLPAPEGDNRSAIAAAAVDKLLQSKPPALMQPKNARLLTPGNIDDDLDKLRDADWVIEAVLEDPDIKRNLYQRLEAVCRADALISSNTSTLPLRVLSHGLPDDFKRRFMITHFFNPPRYMRLLELVTSEELDPAFLAVLRQFADHRLGKGCVICNDTPGFIANRIGTFWLQNALLEAIALKLPVEQCDAAMGLFGIPKTGVFGLLDLVGLDLMPHILKTFKQTLPSDDPLNSIATVPPLLQKMLENGYKGRKGKGGFYRLQPDSPRKIKQALDLVSGEYRHSEKFKFDNISHRPDDLRAFLSADEPLNRFSWRVLADTLCYAASLIPEIADHIVAIDTAMRLGYNWRYGPFELLDRLGEDWFVQRLSQESKPVPKLLVDRQPLYRIDRGLLQFKTGVNAYQSLQRPEGVLSLSDIKRASAPLLANASASSWDIGDGIVCLEFHSKMNTLDPDILTLIGQTVDRVREDYRGLVIYNEADNFSAGANLTLLVPAILEHDWDTVKNIIRLGQSSYRTLKFSPFPVIGAPSGLALGGGCEILLHCDAIQAHAELYLGLVEVGVGLVPAWGGCKELLRRWLEFMKRPGGPMPAIVQVFETIGLAKVSQSAHQAKDWLFLSQHDGVTMNKDRLLADAKARALALADDYQAPEPYQYFLPGASAAAALEIAVRNMRLAGKASDHDAVIAGHLAMILSGADTDITRPLSEQDLSALELETFVELVQQPATLARLQHMLKTGKPLRN